MSTALKALTNGQAVQSTLPMVITFRVKTLDEVFDLDAVQEMNEKGNVRFEGVQHFLFEGSDADAKKVLNGLAFKYDGELLAPSDTGVHKSATGMRGDYVYGDNWTIKHYLGHAVPLGTRQYRISGGGTIVTKRPGKDDEHEELKISVAAILVPQPKGSVNKGTVRPVTDF